MAFKPAVCQPSKPTKRSKCLFGCPNPAGQGSKAPSINNFFLMFKLAVCQPSKPSKRSNCLCGRHNPAGQGTKAPSLAFSWRSSLPFASPQTLQTLQMPFWQRQPYRQTKAPINSFFLAFKPAVCQPSPPNAPNAWMAAPTQAKAPRPHQ